MTAAKQEIRFPPFELIAGNVCLDFINTLDNRPTAEPEELIRSFPDLARFAEQSGILKAQDARYLVGQLRLRPTEAEEAVRRAIELREVLYGVFSAVTERRTPPAAALAKLNAYIREAAEHSRLVRRGE